MRRRLVVLSFACAVLAAACSPTVQFWRPVSEPNILMGSKTLRQKLDYDLSQCHCGIYPSNTAHDDSLMFQKDQQRLAETGVTVSPDDDGKCMQKPSMVVLDCMRRRGWEPTSCSGRMPLPDGGSLCAKYDPEQTDPPNP